MKFYPKTPYGWRNKIVRGLPYNGRTAKILDFTCNPDSCVVRNLDQTTFTKKELNKKNFEKPSERLNTKADFEKIKAALAFSVVVCPGCAQKLRVPRNRGDLIVTCPKCRRGWRWAPLGE